MNVNLSNIISNMSQNAVSNNKLHSGGNSTFMNMLVMMMEYKSAGALQSEDLIDSSKLNYSWMNINNLGLLTGNKINIRGLSDVGTDISDINNCMHGEKIQGEYKAKEELEKLNNFVDFILPGVMMQQISYNKIAETSTSECLLDLTQHESFNTSQNLNYGEKGKAEILNTVTEKESVSNNRHSIMNVSADKLIEEIEEYKDKLKNKIDMQSEMITAKGTLSENQNTIIKLSDESSQIRSQVLSQIKDKILFMVEEGKQTGNTIKYVTMELNPKSLGKVDIKMTFEDNKITVEIEALNEETQKLIKTSAHELANILGKSSESVNIIVKSNDPAYNHQLYNYNSNAMNEQAYQDNENYNQRRHKNNYYYEDNIENKDDDSIFSQLINLRSIKLDI